MGEQNTGEAGFRERRPRRNGEDKGVDPFSRNGVVMTVTRGMADWGKKWLEDSAEGPLIGRKKN